MMPLASYPPTESLDTRLHFHKLNCHGDKHKLKLSLSPLALFSGFCVWREEPGNKAILGGPALGHSDACSRETFEGVLSWEWVHMTHFKGQESIRQAVHLLAVVWRLWCFARFLCAVNSKWTMASCYTQYQAVFMQSQASYLGADLRRAGNEASNHDMTLLRKEFVLYWESFVCRS